MGKSLRNRRLERGTSVFYTKGPLAPSGPLFIRIPHLCDVELFENEILICMTSIALDKIATELLEYWPLLELRQKP